VTERGERLRGRENTRFGGGGRKKGRSATHHKRRLGATHRATGACQKAQNDGPTLKLSGRQQLQCNKKIGHSGKKGNWKEQREAKKKKKINWGQGKVNFGAENL